MFNGEQTTTTTELKNAPPLPCQSEEIRKLTKKKQCKQRELDRAREKFRINIVISEVKGAAGFVRISLLDIRFILCFTSW